MTSPFTEEFTEMIAAEALDRRDCPHDSLTNRERFRQGYRTAMLWANGVAGEGADDTLPAAVAEAADFYDSELPARLRAALDEQADAFLSAEVVALIESVNHDLDLSIQYDYGQAGNDLALTRNGHGAGFWDRGLGDAGDALTDLAKAEGEAHIWMNGDNPTTWEVEL